MTQKTGKNSKIKCKAESQIKPLSLFLNEIQHFKSFENQKKKYVEIITDDTSISNEIATVTDLQYVIRTPEPAPRRIVDKVRTLDIFENFLILYAN